MAQLNSYASLCLYGNDLLPTEITKILHQEPDSSQTKGEVIPCGDGERIAQVGVWLLESRGRVHSAELIDHIEFLLDNIPAELEKLTSLPGVESAYITCFFIVLKCGHHLILEDRLVQECSKYGLGINIDAYSFTEDDLEIQSECPD